MTDWLRMWHGAPTDPKWRTVARRAQVRPGDVWSVVSVLMDRASQASDRGNVAGFDCEIIADALGYDPEEVERIVEALTDKGVIAEGRLASWEKYQPQREDNSTSRVRAHRERVAKAQSADETQCNAAERAETLEERREETEKKDTQTDVCVERAGAPAVPKRQSRASRIAPDWRPKPETWDQIREETAASDAELERELVKARDWSASARNGAKSDHDAFFRNWCRTSSEDGKLGRGPPGAGSNVLDIDRHGNLINDRQPALQNRTYQGDRPRRAGPHDEQYAALAEVFRS